MRHCSGRRMVYHPGDAAHTPGMPGLALPYKLQRPAQECQSSHNPEKGTNENTNGMIRQYAPKRQSLHGLTQHDCTRIARQLNQRPRKRLGYRTPEECYEE